MIYSQQDSAGIKFIHGKNKNDTALSHFQEEQSEWFRNSEIPSFVLVGNSKTLDNNMLTNIKNSMLFVEEKELSSWHKSMKFGTKEINNADYDYLRNLIKSTKISYESNF